MRKLLTIGAVVFLMVFTAGLATAKKPVLTFPFTGTGDLFSITDGGNTGGPLSATITVNETGGLFWGTIAYGSTRINFSAVHDANGTYSLNGIVEGTPVPVQGAFVISLQKVPGLKAKAFAATIEFGTLASFASGSPVVTNAGESFAGVLFD